MNKQEKEQKKLQKKKEKAREKRRRKISNGLDLCLIAFCFLAFLIAALTELVREKAGTAA